MQQVTHKPAQVMDYIFPLLTFIASWAVGIWFYLRMPETVAVHWGLSGQPDRYGSRLEGALAMPLILSLMFAIFFALRNTRAGGYIIKVGGMMGVFMIAIQLIIGLNALGVFIDVTRLVLLSMAILFISLGLIIPQFPQNRYGGFRNRYTLGDEKVWESTNKLGGRMLMVSGLLMVPFAFTPPLIGFIGITAVIIVCIVIVPFIHSMNMYNRSRAQHR